MIQMNVLPCFNSTMTSVTWELQVGPTVFATQSSEVFLNKKDKELLIHALCFLVASMTFRELHGDARRISRIL